MYFNLQESPKHTQSVWLANSLLWFAVFLVPVDQMNLRKYVCHKKYFM
jgi:hypothetical protein